MYRNSILYRRLWYVKRRTARKAKFLMGLAFVVMIMSFLCSYAEKSLMPYVLNVSELKVKSVVTAAVGEVIKDRYNGSIKYSDIVDIDRDAGNRITSVQTDTVELNAVSCEISDAISRRLSEIKNYKVDVPLGMLLGNSIFASAGPPLRIKIKPLGQVDTEFVSQFTSAGINQTRHTVIIKVKARLGLKTLLIGRESDIVVNLPVAETIIVGEVPELYFGDKN